MAQAVAVDLAGSLRARLARVLAHLDRTLTGARSAVLGRDLYAHRAGESPLRPQPPGEDEPLVDFPAPLLPEGKIRLRADEARWLTREQREARELYASDCPPGLRGLRRGGPDGGGEWWSPMTIFRLEGWPLTLPCTVGEALDYTRTHAENLIQDVAAEIRATAEAVIPDETLRRAVLARDVVTKHWPLAIHAANPVRRPLQCLKLAASESAWPEGEPRAGSLGSPWIHPDAAPGDVARWAREGLNALTDPEWMHPWTVPDERNEDGTPGPARPWGDALLREAEGRGGDGFAAVYFIRFASGSHAAQPGDPRIVYTSAGLALIFLAERAVRADLARPLVVVDSGGPHHALVSGFRDYPGKETELVPTSEDGEWRVEILRPDDGRSQLTLPLEGDTVNDAIIRYLQTLKRDEALRVYAAMLQLFSVEGARTGRLRWTRESIFDAMKIAARTRRAEGGMVDSARDITRLLTRARLVVYQESRAREWAVRRARPVFVLVEESERRLGDGEWIPDGAELMLNPLIAGGHRQANGRIGGSFSWTSTGLATLDHRRVPHAFALGLVLPIRWHMDARRGRAWPGLSGRNWLKTAGIAWRDHPSDIVAAFATLDRTLSALVEVDLVGEVRGRDPWELDKVVTALPSPAIADRLRGLLPALPSSKLAEVPLTGAELRAWRKARHWTQGELATRTRVGERTIRGHEARADRPLPPPFREALGLL